MSKFRSMVGRLFKTYVVDALSYMAMGLFCSLIVGTIIAQFAAIPHLEILGDIANILKQPAVVGGSIGLAIAYGFNEIHQ